MQWRWTKLETFDQVVRFECPFGATLQDHLNDWAEQLGTSKFIVCVGLWMRAIAEFLEPEESSNAVDVSCLVGTEALGKFGPVATPCQIMWRFVPDVQGNVSKSHSVSQSLTLPQWLAWFVKSASASMTVSAISENTVPPVVVHSEHQASTLQCEVDLQVDVGCTIISARGPFWGSEARVTALSSAFFLSLGLTPHGGSSSSEYIITCSFKTPFDQRGATIASMLAASFKANHTRPCVSFGDITLTYSEAYDWILRFYGLACRVIAKGEVLIMAESGVHRGQVVGVALDRSFELPLVIAALIMKGATYCTLPLTFPEDRQDAIIRKTGMQTVVCDSHHAARFQGLPEILHVITTDAVDSIILGAPHCADPDPSDCDVDGLDVAYMVHTSGSTGEPKTVLIQQAASASYLRAMTDEGIGIVGSDVVLQTSPTTFDPHVYQVLGTFAAGAELVMLRPNSPLVDLAYVAQTMARHQVSYAVFVPSLAAVLFSLPPEDLTFVDSLRIITCSGEPFDWSLAQLLDSVCNAPTRLVNAYGPVECSDLVLTYEVQRPVSRQLTGGLPSGRPLPGRSCRITTPLQGVCPPGLAGELLVGGPGVMKGYMARPDLTAQALATPDSDEQVYYRTGDRVVFCEATQQIRYLGRVDFQLKLHGQRLEPGEIEAVIMSVTGVKKAVVLKLPGKEKLVAFVECTEGRAEQEKTLAMRNVCTRRLAQYMIPALFVHLQQWPLNANGKVSRPALLTSALFSACPPSGAWPRK